MKIFWSRFFIGVVAVSSFIPVTAIAETQFEMCMADEASPNASWTADIEFELDKNFAGVVDIIWVDFDGKQKTYKTLSPGQNFKSKSYAGHHWVVARKDNVFAKPSGCAYFDAIFPNSKHVISDHNAANPDGSLTYSGSWEWKNEARNSAQQGNWSNLTVHKTGKVKFCYNETCFDSQLVDHGEHISFKGNGGYYEFARDEKKNEALGSFWGPGTNPDKWPEASITMTAGDGP